MKNNKEIKETQLNSNVNDPYAIYDSIIKYEPLNKKDILNDPSSYDGIVILINSPYINAIYNESTEGLTIVTIFEIDNKVEYEILSDKHKIKKDLHSFSDDVKVLGQVKQIITDL